MADPKTSKTSHAQGSEISEGEGRLPWWVWLVLLLWLIYAFFIGPFNLTSPRG